MSKYAQQLEKLGFRDWYEKRLVHAHLYLTLCILALVMLAASAESLSLAAPTPAIVIDASLLFASGAIAAWGWLKYQRHMLMANELAHYATCPQCEHYGALTFPKLAPNKVGLRCKKCGHEWEHETDLFA
jgi:hypothetical protein